MRQFSQNASRVPDDVIAENDIGWYWRVGTFPAGLVVLALAFGGQAVLESWLQYVIEGVGFFALTFLVWRERTSRRDAVAVNVLFGLLIGVATAILGSLHTFSFYRVFSFVAAPLASALLGAVIAVLAVFFFRRIPRLHLALFSRSRA